MKTTLKIAAIALATIAFAAALNAGLNKQEEVDCYTWQKQAKEYQNFYLTTWQAEQCEAHGIEVDAPVGQPSMDQGNNFSD